MPVTNFAPEGYELIVHDDQLCRHFAFYAPGANTSNRIDAAHVSPNFLIYRRLESTSTARQGVCCHVKAHFSRVSSHKRKREVAMLKAKNVACQLQRAHSGQSCS